VPDFARRSAAAELMDTDSRDFEDYRTCLADLAQVNRVTATHRPTLRFLEDLRRRGLLVPGHRARLVDAGSGYGDLLRAVDRWAVRRGLDLELLGVDLNPWAARAAAAATPRGRPIRYLTGDVFEAALGTVDVVVSSQLAHHLDDGALRRFLRWMEGTARLGWCVADLHRHPLPYHAFRIASRAIGWHRFVCHDGPVSIARSLTLAEWRAAIAGAELGGVPVRLAWHVPFRVSVSRSRDG
jgi:SAM-dependent methyltransferase